MATLVAMTVEQQLAHVREVLDQKAWEITSIDASTFTVSMSASDGSLFVLRVVCDKYPGFPPAFHWCDPETGALGQPKNTPAANGGFFHGKGVICAPWNRLAYSSEDARGPHGDWDIGNWRTNSHTKACTTLLAMLLRIDYELKHKFKGRMA